MPQSSNPQLELAYEYVQYTNKNIFLTGKAGTGKTTFLHKIKAESIKRMAIVAPTGVAAINASGMTIHSLFQLPFGPFIPNQTNTNQRRFSKQKIKLIKSLDLLIIDEISMVRADLLDAIDDVLRRYKDRHKPFGGLQLLMIGDLHQLPPVIKPNDWDLLRAHYNTPYFFGSLALQQTNPITIQLKHIYRQSDENFIALLNKVRNNQLDQEVLNLLNSRYIPNFQADEDNHYITLTSHNASALKINQEHLDALKEEKYTFKATIEDTFPTYAYPTEAVLAFKKGAQVLFIKNDHSPEKRYYNGKIGKIVSINKTSIEVQCPNEETTINVVPTEWKNVKYELNEQSKEVTESEIGTFTQMPLKLAWAITIHKSQGLTFERAIIDAQSAFAHGQVYVALSRCKSFEGIVLRSKIGSSSVRTDQVVKNYSALAEKNEPTPTDLEQSKKMYQQTLISDLFNFQKIRRLAQQLHRIYFEHENTLSTPALEQLNVWIDTAEEQLFSIGDKFQAPLKSYFAQAETIDTNEALQARIKKASVYFGDKISNHFLAELKNIPVITDNQAVLKSAKEKLKTLLKALYIKNACFTVTQTSFDPVLFVKAKTDADLDFEKPKQKSMHTPSKTLQNTSHPELYHLLRTWRANLAAELEVKAFEILANRTIFELIEFLPVDGPALKRIKGIGKVKLERYGKAIIAIIEQYCQDKSIASNLMPLPAPKPAKTAKINTKEVSLNLFKSGKSITEIAKERDFVISTIQGHLAHYIGLGELDIFEVVDRVSVDEIEAFMIANKDKPTSEIKVHFNNRYSYGILRMVREYLRSQELVD